MDPFVKYVEEKVAKEIAKAKDATITTAKRLLKAGISLDLIASSTELSLDIVKGF